MGFRSWLQNEFGPIQRVNEPGNELLDLSQEELEKPESFPEPLDYYIHIYKTNQERLRQTFNGKTPYSTDDNIRRIASTYAISSKGFDALPFALSLLNDKNPEFREDGTGILMSLGKDEHAFESLKNTMEHETDLTVLAGLIGALPKVGGKKAIPLLAKILRNPDADADIRWDAMYSLGKIVHILFEKRSDRPIELASEWLDKNGY